jgi:type I restriction enzyme S subunit
MELKPGYKQTEVGAIPEDWSCRPIKEFASTVRGGSPRPAGDPRYFNGSFIPWLTVASLTGIPDSQLFVTETSTALTEEGANHSRTLAAGTLIVANSGATLGVAKILGIKCCANDGIAALQKVEKNVSAPYLAHYINTKTNYLRDVVATGNGQPNLNTGLISEFKVPLPPTKVEQEAIAEALSDADALIESLDQLIAKKRQIKQGATQELLTGRRRLPGFSGDWEVKTFADLFTFSGGYSASRDQLSTEGYCYLHYGDIHGATKTSVDTHADYQNIPKLKVSLKRVSPNSLLKDGDVVFVDASEDDDGTSRHVVVVNKQNVPFISGLHTIVAKSKTEELVYEYRQHCFKTPAIRQQFLFYAVGTKVSGISKTNIAKLTLPIPSVPEQTAIAAILSDMDTELAALESRLAKARHIKQGMMQELLTGRIRLL